MLHNQSTVQASKAKTIIANIFILCFYVSLVNAQPDLLFFYGHALSALHKINMILQILLIYYNLPIKYYKYCILLKIIIRIEIL